MPHNDALLRALAQLGPEFGELSALRRSVRRYPLPILSKSQLMEMEGATEEVAAAVAHCLPVSEADFFATLCRLRTKPTSESPIPTGVPCEVVSEEEEEEPCVATQQLLTLSLAQLRDICSRASISQSGTKSALVARFVAHIRSPVTGRLDEERLNTALKTVREPTKTKKRPRDDDEVPPTPTIAEGTKARILTHTFLSQCRKQTSLAMPQVVVMLDHRETTKRTDLRDAVVRNDVVVEQTALPVGDAVFLVVDPKGEAGRFVLPFIVERKRKDDLLSSITKDARYAEQKAYLAGSGCRRAFLLVEHCELGARHGAFSTRSAETDKQTVATASLSTSLMPGFALVTTRDVTESGNWIASMVESLRLALAGCADIAALNQRAMTLWNKNLVPYTQWKSDRLEQRDAVRDATVFPRMLGVVRHCSEQAANAVADRFSCTLHLWRELRAAQQQQGEGSLARSDDSFLVDNCGDALEQCGVKPAHQRNLSFGINRVLTESSY